MYLPPKLIHVVTAVWVPPCSYCQSNPRISWNKRKLKKSRSLSHVPDVRHWYFRYDGQITRQVNRVLKTRFQVETEIISDYGRRNSSSKLTHIWVCLLMVILVIKCLGIICVKGGPWLTSGCIIGAKLCNLTEFHFLSIRWTWKHLFCRIIVIIHHKYILPQIVFQKMATPMHLSQSYVHFFSGDSHPPTESWGLYFVWVWAHLTSLINRCGRSDAV